MAEELVDQSEPMTTADASAELCAEATYTCVLRASPELIRRRLCERQWELASARMLIPDKEHAIEQLRDENQALESRVALLREVAARLVDHAQEARRELMHLKHRARSLADQVLLREILWNYLFLPFAIFHLKGLKKRAIYY